MELQAYFRFLVLLARLVRKHMNTTVVVFRRVPLGAKSAYYLRRVLSHIRLCQLGFHWRISVKFSIGYFLKICQ
jgi:S-ribosylhomocysteine lyase LuxS involved in autoinducer biosynthesis